MFTEQQNFAVVQTQLDSVFYQNFDYDSTHPGIATANTAALFKPLQTTHAAYIEQVFKGSGYFPVVGETQTVPQSTPQVKNQLTTYIKDFAQSIEISKNLFDDFVKVLQTILSSLNRKNCWKTLQGAISSRAT